MALDKETTDKIAAAVSAAVSAALAPSAEPQKPPEPSAPSAYAAPATNGAPASQTPATPSKDAHKWDTMDDGSGRIFCNHCKTKALPMDIDTVKGPEELLNAMQNIYHPKGKDWLACKDCRTTFSEAMNRMGYNVEAHKDGRIEIEKK